eukprot:6709480-Ditylum_brightwellii.AAC.1
MQKLESNGIEGQIIADVLQQGGHFCSAAEVLHWQKMSVGQDTIAPSRAKTPSSSNNPYSPWTRTSFCVGKQHVCWCDKLDPFTTPDPIMPQSSAGTNNKWIEEFYHEDFEEKKAKSFN